MLKTDRKYFAIVSVGSVSLGIGPQRVHERVTAQTVYTVERGCHGDAASLQDCFFRGGGGTHTYVNATDRYTVCINRHMSLQTEKKLD